MNKIAVVTATRAEYGLLSPVIKELRKYEDAEFSVELIVTGTHLYEKFGYTIAEIDDRIDHEILISVDSQTSLDISINQSDTLVKFTELFLDKNYNAVILLGDRYEVMAIAIAAGNTCTPIFHMCGGDTTEGAIDEWVRHSVTKMSYLHFVTNVESRRRVIQLGEDPSRVFNYGSTSLDNVLSVADMGKDEALRSIGLSDCQYALCTYHPVTMEMEDVGIKLNEVLNALSSFPDIQFIFTKSNSDLGGSRINTILESAEVKYENLHVFSSLGVRRYLSLMKHALFVLGNSSSGLIEAPAFQIATVNIGDRQRGRLQSKSVINCSDSSDEIIKSIQMAISDEHNLVCHSVVSPYGDGHAAERISKKVIEIIRAGKIDLKKKFYDLGVFTL